MLLSGPYQFFYGFPESQASLLDLKIIPNFPTVVCFITSFLNHIVLALSEVARRLENVFVVFLFIYFFTFTMICWSYKDHKKMLFFSFYLLKIDMIFSPGLVDRVCYENLRKYNAFHFLLKFLIRTQIHEVIGPTDPNTFW